MKKRQLSGLLVGILVMLVLADLTGVFDRTTGRPIVAIPAHEVTEFELRAAGQDTSLIVQRQPGGWHIIQPVAYPADPLVVNTFLTQLSTMEVIDEEITEPERYVRFGLAESQALYALVVVGEAAYPLWFGQDQAGTGFLRVGTDPRVLTLAEPVWPSTNPEDWR